MSEAEGEVKVDESQAPHGGVTDPSPPPDDMVEGEAGEETTDAEAAARGETQPQAAGDEAEAGPVDEQAARIEALEAEVARFRDQWVRTSADFDNFRKRSRRDLEEARRVGTEKALLELLPVADNLDRAVGAATATSEIDSLVDGMKMVLKSFEDSLTKLGVERVPGAGENFDPSIHEAVQQQPSEEAPAGVVLKEWMPGYRLSGKLLRAAMVVVSAGPGPGGTEAANRGDSEAAGATQGDDGVVMIGDTEQPGEATETASAEAPAGSGPPSSGAPAPSEATSAPANSQPPAASESAEPAAATASEPPPGGSGDNEEPA